MNRRHVDQRRTRLLRWAVALLTLVTVFSVGGAAASASASNDWDRSQLEVMTRNLYLGSDLTPALAATHPRAFLRAVARIYATVQFTNFPIRAAALADEMATDQPDLVGLQEVSRWVTDGPGVPLTLDFLEVLTSELAKRGLHYTVASTSQNANIGPVPLVTPCLEVGKCTVTLQDRDVILVNADRAGLRWHNPKSGNYVAQQTFTPPLPNAPAVSFNRGWATIDGWLEGRPFHFATTHLETEDFPAVQQAQAAEFLAGPALGRGADIAVGDFNSAADGSTTATYSMLTRVFNDAWRVNHGRPGLTCCRNETLSNPVRALRTRIDLVLYRDGAQATSAHLVGVEPFEATAPLWASDHAGVVATLRLESWW